MILLIIFKLQEFIVTNIGNFYKFHVLILKFKFLNFCPLYGFSRNLSTFICLEDEDTFCMAYLIEKPINNPDDPHL